MSYRWPYLQTLSLCGEFSPVDYFFAESLLADEHEANEELAALCMALIAATRKGHLCLHIGKELNPSFQGWFVNPSEERHFIDLVVNGAGFESRLFTKKGAPLIREDDRIYLQKSWAFETKVFKALSELLAPSSMDKAECEIGKQYNLEQRKAIQTAMNDRFSIITGGPGTGKTYTAAGIIREFVHRTSGKEPLIFLMAPTGKAALHLYSSLKKQVDLDEKNVRFGTIHSFLHRLGSVEENNKFRADLLIVDEASMIDAKVFAALLNGFDREHTVVLMGDRDQLPPVESGSLFADLVTGAEKVRPEVVSTLQQCMRSDVEHLLDFARGIRKGKIEKEEHFLSSIVLDEKKRNSVYQEILSSVATRFLSPGKSFSAEEVLQKLDEFSLLSCVNRGPFGVETLNAVCFAHFQQQMKAGEIWPIPLIVTKTDYRLGLFNGEKGVLMRSSSDPKESSRDVVVFSPNDQSPEIRKIPAALIRHYQWAYAISVHKSQGSEFDRVFLLLPKGAEMFGREALYTAVTRARSHIEIATTENILEEMVERSGEKVSGLKERLAFDNPMTVP